MSILEALVNYSDRGIGNALLLAAAAGAVLLIAWGLCVSTNDSKTTSCGVIVESTNLFTMGLFGIAGIAFIVTIVVSVYSMAGQLKSDVVTYRKEMDRAVAADFNAIMPPETVDACVTLNTEGRETLEDILSGHAGSVSELMAGRGP